MTKQAHTIECASRKNIPGLGCDCMLGWHRRVTKLAQKAMKRQRQKIATNTGLPYEQTLQEK